MASPVHVPHTPQLLDGYLQWRVEPVVMSLVEKAAARSERLLISLDGWGSDIAFLDRHGRRLGPLRSYRDPGLACGFDEVRRRRVDDLVAERTGCVVSHGSTVSQLLAYQREKPPWLADVATVVPLVDYLGYRLTGVLSAGMSSSSSTSLVKPSTRSIDRTLCDALGIPESWFGDPLMEGGAAGQLTVGTGALVKVAGHDTATALRAGYGEDAGRLFVSLGSWAVVGVIAPESYQEASPTRTVQAVMHELTGNGRLRINRDVPGMRALQLLEAEWFAREPTPAERTSYLPQPSPWVDQPTLDVFELDAQPPGGVDQWITAVGHRLGIQVETRADRAAQALRAVAAGIATAVADLRQAGLVAPERGLWLCGGGTRVKALVGWIAELTGSEPSLGPIDASAVGGVVGCLEALGIAAGAGSLAAKV